MLEMLEEKIPTEIEKSYSLSLKVTNKFANMVNYVFWVAMHNYKLGYLSFV